MIPFLALEAPHVELREEVNRAIVRDAGVGSLVHYPITPHKHVAYAAAGFARDAFPLAAQMADEVLSLPMGPHLPSAQVGAVIAALRKC